MDSRTRRDLDRLLGDLEHQRQEERHRERQERIREASHAYRFERVKQEALRPALRQIQERLERRGDLTRLNDSRSNRIRLELLMQAAVPVRGTLEIELDETSGNVAFRARRQHVPAGERLLRVDEVTPRAAADLLVELLRVLTEASDTPGRRPAPAR